MPTVLLDVPAPHLDAYLLILREEAITHRWLDSRDGVLEIVHTVEIEGSDLQIQEAAHLLDQMDLERYAFRVTDRRLNRVLRIANHSGVKVVRMEAGFRIFGRLWIHLVEVSGREPDMKNFKVLKKRSGTIR
jgi:acetolactate synthase regulatory subunit